MCHVRVVALLVFYELACRNESARGHNLTRHRPVVATETPCDTLGQRCILIRIKEAKAASSVKEEILLAGITVGRAKSRHS